ncbi:Uncharacterized conserved protein YybS, DUF2232 family [Clostridium acidisoli DSM 12555]|uniref:Uncharacterized conserved protein YybS, DUF2232 family n=1 Tax=Clostridium acidisoli DSM 12555 TaxID=1121291 RepID=A0A1W1XS67_9CLOT|nr:DUF2232 domain-containing protein [Clostridium acidisoli]SMC26692.1 Uncharacterized conserved protein YybS, DUF2232 family [Clostridium acidisoli DSM 12555]
MQNKTNNTRAITESGIMAAVLLVIMLLTSYIPTLSLLAYVILPTVVALIYVRNGAKYSVTALIIALILGFMLTNLVQIITIGPVMPFVGIPLGYCIKNKKKPANTIIFTSIGFLIVTAITFFILPLFIYSNGFIGAVAYIVKEFNQSLDLTKTIYLNSGISKDIVNQVDGFKVTSTKIFEMMPTAMVTGSLFYGMISYKVTEIIFKKLNISMEKRRNFTYFFVPNLILAFLIVFICIGLLFQNKNMIIGEYIYTTGILLFTILLYLDAIAYMSYFLRNRSKLPKSLIVFVILILMMILNSWFVLIGVIDSIFDFRKLDSNRIRKD